MYKCSFGCILHALYTFTVALVCITLQDTPYYHNICKKKPTHQPPPPPKKKKQQQTKKKKPTQKQQQQQQQKPNNPPHKKQKQQQQQQQQNPQNNCLNPHPSLMKKEKIRTKNQPKTKKAMLQNENKIIVMLVFEIYVWLYDTQTSSSKHQTN